MVKDARYIIRLRNDRSYTPAMQPQLLQKIRECARTVNAQAMNVRVTQYAIEFDLFMPENRNLRPALSALERVAGTLTYKRLDTPPLSEDPASVVMEARTLFNEERYWEAHEVLEGLWRQRQGPEKQLLQGLILTAAALVHIQKNELKVVPAMLQDAARRLENQPAEYFGLDVRHFLKNLNHMITRQTSTFPSI
jgi:hypothetical protein